MKLHIWKKLKMRLRGSEVEQVEDVTVLNFSWVTAWKSSCWFQNYHTSHLRISKIFGMMIEDSKLCDVTRPDYPGKIRIIQKWRKRVENVFFRYFSTQMSRFWFFPEKLVWYSERHYRELSSLKKWANSEVRFRKYAWFCETYWMIQKKFFFDFFQKNFFFDSESSNSCKKHVFTILDFFS